MPEPKEEATRYGRFLIVAEINNNLRWVLKEIPTDSKTAQKVAMGIAARYRSVLHPRTAKVYVARVTEIIECKQKKKQAAQKHKPEQVNDSK